VYALDVPMASLVAPTPDTLEPMSR
jgi:hypothetical protein